MFEQGGDILLDVLELIELQIGIDDGEQVARPGLLINKNAPAVANKLFLDLQQALAFEHNRQDVAGGNESRVIFLDELAQQ